MNSEDLFQEEKKSKFKSVIRFIHNAEHQFVQLNKKALWGDVSLKAAGLWARCLSRKDDWKFYMSELIESCKEGRDAVYSAMRELIQKNYVMRLDWKVKGEDGKYIPGGGGSEYIFFEVPACEWEKKEIARQFKNNFQHVEKPDPVQTDAANQQLVITINNKIYIHEEKSGEPKVPQPSAKASAPPSSKKQKENFMEVFPGIFLTATEEKLLLERCEGDREKLRKVYKRYSFWKGDKGMKTIKGDYKKIVSWVFEALKEDERKSEGNKKQEHEDRKYAEKLWEHAKKRGDTFLTLGSNYIHFDRGVCLEPLVINFGEKDFQKKCKQYLQNLGMM